MKLTVFALLLVVLAISVLAAIFRSGMMQFDQQLTPAVSQNVHPARGKLSPVDRPERKRRLKPWLRRPVRDAQAESGEGLAVAGGQAPAQDTLVDGGDAGMVSVPVGEEALVSEEAAVSAEAVVSEEELVAWREELVAREEALLAAESEQEAWFAEQEQILAEQQQLVDDQALLALEQQALEVEAQLAQEALLAAEQEQEQIRLEQQAYFEAEQRQILAERAYLEQQLAFGSGFTAGRIVENPQAAQRRAQEQDRTTGVVPLGLGGGNQSRLQFAPPIRTAAPPIATAAPPIRTAVPQIPTSAPPLRTAAPPLHQRQR